MYQRQLYLSSWLQWPTLWHWCLWASLQFSWSLWKFVWRGSTTAIWVSFSLQSLMWKKIHSRPLGILDNIFFAFRLWTFSTVCAKIQRIDGRKKWRHFSLLIAGANASPDGRVSIAKSPKRWTVRIKWTMIIVSIAGLNALKMHALFPSLLLSIIFGSDMVLDQLF